jgi:hypothetical protein
VFFYSHFIMSLKSYDMIAIYHVFVHNNYFVLPTEHTLNYLRKKLNSSMSNFGERLGQPSKMKLILFSAKIIQQVVDF